MRRASTVCTLADIRLAKPHRIARELAVSASRRSHRAGSGYEAITATYAVCTDSAFGGVFLSRHGVIIAAPSAPPRRLRLQRSFGRIEHRDAVKRIIH